MLQPAPPTLPFTLTRSAQAKSGDFEMETTYEGYCTYFHDPETEMAFWEVDAVLTGFAQYEDGKVVCKVEGLKRSAELTVTDWPEFERQCINRAEYEYEIKQQGR